MINKFGKQRYFNKFTPNKNRRSPYRNNKWKENSYLSSQNYSSPRALQEGTQAVQTPQNTQILQTGLKQTPSET